MRRSTPQHPLPYIILSFLTLIHFSRQQDSKNIYDTRFDNVTWDNANWIIHSSVADPGHYQSRANLANGYIGINVASLGPFFEADSQVDGDNINGWPLFDRRQAFATVAGFYDVQAETNGTNFKWLNQLGGESVISGIPHWSGLHVKLGDNVLAANTDPAQITDFHSTLDFRSGLLSWDYTWSPPGGPDLGIAYSMFVHKLYVNRAVVQLRITSSADANVTVLDVLNGDCALRADLQEKRYEGDSPMIWSAVQPHWIPYVTAYVYSTLVDDKSVDMSSRAMVTHAAYIGGNASSIAQGVNVSLQASQTSTIQKYVGIASTDGFKDPQTVAHDASYNASCDGYQKLLASHVQEWKSIMTEDSIDNYTLPDTGTLPDDPNLIEQQILAVASPFYLLQNTIGQNPLALAGTEAKLDVNSIAVGGLSSDSYGGLVFWDVEVWMAPGLVVAHPAAAKQIANYRLEKLPQAKANINTSYITSQNMTDFSPGAAVYPWTSGRFGNCTGTGPCFDYEYHINGDISLELENYYIVSGDVNRFRDDYFPIDDALSRLYESILYLNDTTQTYMLNNATDPDEYANMVNNPAYTMALFSTRLSTTNAYRNQFNQTALTPSLTNVELPLSGPPTDIILEYSSMNGSISVKQADVVLIDDFLIYPNPYTLSDLSFYAGRQSSNGPGMTFGVFANVAATYATSGCASYTYFLYSSQPYLRAPWFQFSEQLDDDFTTNGGTHPAYPFLTGAGGAHRVPIFGFLGLKLRPDVLSVDPSLPPQIPHLRYRTIYWSGHAISASSNATHTTLARLPANASLPTANSSYASSDIPVLHAGSNVTYTLPPYPHNGIVLPNRQSYLNDTIAGNLVQCANTTSPDSDNTPGLFPLAATDGSQLTTWQPTMRNKTSSLVIPLKQQSTQIKGFHIDWAATPALNYSISISNTSSLPSGDNGAQQSIYSAPHVSISSPFDAQVAAKAAVVPYGSNVTDVMLEPPVAAFGQSVVLRVFGSANDSAAEGGGCTVAEFALVGA